MKILSSNFNWNQAKAFLATAESGSLSAAAQMMKVSQPTLSRQVAALEEELGVVLFERTGRGLALTPSGSELVAHVKKMNEAANQLALSAMGQSERLEGHICISTTDFFGAEVMPRLIKKFRTLEPGIVIELIATNSASDLIHREADIAIRSFRPTQADLVGKKLTDVYASLYATPQYLEGLGNPTKITDFKQAEFIGFTNNEPYVEALKKLGFELSENSFPVICENHTIHWELVKHGVGIGVMTEETAKTEPLVCPILSKLPLLTAELWLVAHREVKTSKRVRRVYDFLAEHLTHIKL